jgi:hypothetical protein
MLSLSSSNGTPIRRLTPCLAMERHDESTGRKLVLLGNQLAALVNNNNKRP